MARIDRPAQLAAKLARAADDIAVTHGGTAAQVLAYALYLRRVEPTPHIRGFIERFPDGRAIAMVEEILDRADLESVCAGYRIARLDPAISFHGDFLRACDPQGARKRGVHYSPPAVVSYIVRGVESVLRTRFGCRLADAVVLDPCCGIGTFLSFVADHTASHPRMIGLELMPAAQQIAALRLERAEVLLADGLSNVMVTTEGAPLVIVGNPPYSGHSANAGSVAGLLADYRADLSERNPKWLQDDYVKFIRMAQHRVEAAGRGIVAFITNHSFIFNPTFRVMRESLMRTFDEIHILDLSGNSRRDRTRDKNIFPIQTGVSVFFMTRVSGSRPCRVYHAELRGSRIKKLDRLSVMGLEDTPWREITPAEPFRLFVPHRADLRHEYSGFVPLSDIFEQSCVGFVTSRDAFAVAFDRESLLERIGALRDDTVPADELRARFPVGDLDVEAARRALRRDPHWQDRAVEVLYRPFDRRWAYCSPAVMERPRLPFMENLMRPNVAIAVGRAGHATGSDEWDVVFCTDRPTDLNLFRRGGATLFPRFIYEGDDKRSNMMTTDDPDELFGYVYAVLNSGVYRTRYASFLSIDFPRIPLPRDREQLHELARLGRELVSLHLMRDLRASAEVVGEVRAHIGGYELPRKYLDDRRKRGLTTSDTTHVQRIAIALTQAAGIRGRIDEALDRRPPWGRQASI